MSPQIAILSITKNYILSWDSLQVYDKRLKKDLPLEIFAILPGSDYILNLQKVKQMILFSSNAAWLSAYIFNQK